MERSSPLAAMQPPSLSFGQWGCGSSIPTSYCNYEKFSNVGLDFGSSRFNFNLKDLSMTKPSTDYFSLKPVRGSSPTSSLAADLSQNFHIDRTPQLPTPRRSLFSQNLLGTIRGRECATTPPPPSSSPGPGNDSMDISPLPHKAPFSITQNQSPTPEASQAKKTILESPKSEHDNAVDASRPSLPFGRRRSTFSRPLVSRTKSCLVSSASLKPTRVETQLSTLKFGNGPPLTSSLLSPDECFAPSPPQEKKCPGPIPLVIGSKSKQPFSCLSSQSRNSGSPVVGHVRKPSMPNQRPRKHFRRSLSMFEHPEEILMQEKTTIENSGALDSIMDVDDIHQLKLPHFTSGEEGLPRITKETLIDVLDGKYRESFDHSIVVDCRFEYEYKGGHIEGAINYNDKEELAGHLFESASTDNTLLVFHCEYSAHRAPIMAKFVRQKDRAVNADRYPSLTYPEVYILDGGYSSFFDDHRFRCFPQNYVEMAAKEYENACEQGLGKIKQQRAKLCRAKTFAFGQQNQSIDDSPTGASRQCRNLMMGMDIEANANSGARQFISRRMLSY